MILNGHFALNSVFAPVCLELWSLAFEAWLLLNLQWMSSANFKPKRTAAASRGFLATAWPSFCFAWSGKLNQSAGAGCARLDSRPTYTAVMYGLCHGDQGLGVGTQNLYIGLVARDGFCYGLDMWYSLTVKYKFSMWKTINKLQTSPNHC